MGVHMVNQGGLRSRVSRFVMGNHGGHGMARLGRCFHTRLVALVVSSAITIAGIVAYPLPGRAEFPGDVSGFRPIRIEGYWGRERDAPKVLDVVTFTSSNGGPRRIFGVTALQAYKPEEEGVQVLRHSGLQPAIRVLGPEDLVHRFMNPPDGTKVVAFGVYRPGGGTLTLTSVEVSGATESP
jgi:hypothetical protein